MGEVYEALQEKPVHRRVAFKVIKRDMLAAASPEETLGREVTVIEVLRTFAGWGD